MKKLTLATIFTLCFMSFSYSQFVAHELGVIAGASSFQSDYGERRDFKSTAGNIGFHIGAVYYVDFSWLSTYRSRSSYFQDYFKLKSELSFTKVNLKHYGRWVKGSSTGSQQLRAMHGSTSIVNLGLELVWFPTGIRYAIYNDIGTISPFASLGFQFNRFSPTVKSDLGEFGTPIATPTKYLDGYKDTPGSTFSLIGSVGMRYKIGRNSELGLDLRAQYYFSDWVDGVKPDPTYYKENKKNDFSVGVNIGYIYQFE